MGDTVDKDIYRASDKTTGNAKFTEDLVRSLRAEYRAGRITVRAICTGYEMSAEAVRRMLRGETWAWVKERKTEDEISREAGEMQARLIKAMNEQGLVVEAAIEVQQELGAHVPQSVIDQATALLGRKPGSDE